MKHTFKSMTIDMAGIFLVQKNSSIGPYRRLEACADNEAAAAKIVDLIVEKSIYSKEDFEIAAVKVKVPKWEIEL